MRFGLVFDNVLWSKPLVSLHCLFPLIHPLCPLSHSDILHHQQPVDCRYHQPRHFQGSLAMMTTQPSLLLGLNRREPPHSLPSPTASAPPPWGPTTPCGSPGKSGCSLSKSRTKLLCPSHFSLSLETKRVQSGVNQKIFFRSYTRPIECAHSLPLMPRRHRRILRQLVQPDGMMSGQRRTPQRSRTQDCLVI